MHPSFVALFSRLHSPPSVALSVTVLPAFGNVSPVAVGVRFASGTARPTAGTLSSTVLAVFRRLWRSAETAELLRTAPASAPWCPLSVGMASVGCPPWASRTFGGDCGETESQAGQWLCVGSVGWRWLRVGCHLKIPHLRVRLSLLQCGAEGPRGGRASGAGSVCLHASAEAGGSGAARERDRDRSSQEGGALSLFRSDFSFAILGFFASRGPGGRSVTGRGSSRWSS